MRAKLSNITFILVITLFPQILFAGGNIKGVVTDKKSGETLVGAHIIVEELNLATSTNKKGEYFIRNIPQGSYTITTTYIGYIKLQHKVDVINYRTYVVNFHLDHEIVEMDETIITATRTKRKVKDIPASVAVITNEQIQTFAYTSIDDLLRNVSGIYVNRNQGVFSKSNSVTMRGLNSSSRTLILLNGVPMNKADKGFINWNRIIPENIGRIEIIKGPGSAIYGSNAMGGIINIITKQPAKKLSGQFKGFSGTYNILGGVFNLKGNNIKKSKGIYWGINGFYRQGDGYIFEPENTRDSTDVKAGLIEYHSGVLVGYRFNQNHTLEVEYNLARDKRGDGRLVYDDDGGFNQYTTNYIRSRYKGKIKTTTIEANLFFQMEEYYRQKESLKSSGVYSLSNTETNRNDKGILLNATKKLNKYHKITTGFDIKSGSVDASDIYKTSTDIVNNSGKLNIYAVFVQDEINIFSEKLKIIAGLRYDYASFSDGDFNIEEPSAITEFMNTYQLEFSNEHWQAVSPKLAIQYTFTNNIRSYISYGRGFRPPILDDMCRNGSITKGYKLANPNLKPEKLDNLELGVNFKLFNRLTVEPSFYYSYGTDFQYFVGNGDSLYTGGSKLKPVLQRQNMSKIEIAGAEINLTYFLTNSLRITSYFTHNFSKVLEYEVENPAFEDLTGKQLNEVPENMFFAGLNWKNKLLTMGLTYKFVDQQWYDVANTWKVDGYSLVNIKISKTINQKYFIALSIKDLLDEIYIDRKGLQSPGRFILFELGLII